MQVAFLLVLERMVPYVLLIAVGVVAVKCKALGAQSLGALSRFAIHFSIPCLVFTTLVNTGDRAALFASWPYLFLVAGLLLLQLAVGAFGARLLGLGSDRARIHRAMSAFGNLGMVGIPLMTGLFGDACAIYLSLFIVVDQLLLWTYGVRLGAPKEQAKALGFSVKKFFSPVMVALLLGMLCVAVGFRPTGIVMDTVTGLGATTRYLAMIYIGGTLVTADARTALRQKGCWLIVLCKMLAVPVAAYCLMRLLGVALNAAASFAALAAVPSMGTMAIIARANGSDDRYASAVTFVTTLVSAVTLPLLLWGLPKLL